MVRALVRVRETVLSRRADLTAVYEMIFRRLRSVGADWVYHFPQLYLAELGRSGRADERGASYSVSDAAAAELQAQKDRAEGAPFAPQSKR